MKVNRTVEEKDRPRLSRQAQEIYEALQRGPMRTSQLVQLAVQYNARLKEVRDYLRADGLTVDCVFGDAGNNLYEIRPFAGSRYQHELLKKGALHNER